MGQLLITAEAVAGICLLSVLVFLLVTYLRRRALSRDGEVVVCSLRGMGADRWRPGLLRRTDFHLEWHRMFGATTRPMYRWERHRLELGNLSQDAAEVVRDQVNAGLFSGEPVLVPVEAPGRNGTPMKGELALAPGPYTALRAWVEASPPRALPC